jgi:hypothetical protein
MYMRISRIMIIEILWSHGVRVRVRVRVRVGARVRVRVRVRVSDVPCT